MCDIDSSGGGVYQYNMSVQHAGNETVISHGGDASFIITPLVLGQFPAYDDELVLRYKFRFHKSLRGKCVYTPTSLLYNNKDP